VHTDHPQINPQGREISTKKTERRGDKGSEDILYKRGEGEEKEHRGRFPPSPTTYLVKRVNAGPFWLYGSEARQTVHLGNLQGGKRKPSLRGSGREKKPSQVHSVLKALSTKRKELENLGTSKRKNPETTVKQKKKIARPKAHLCARSFLRGRGKKAMSWTRQKGNLCFHETKGTSQGERGLGRKNQSRKRKGLKSYCSPGREGDMQETVVTQRDSKS